ncbi:hypothetical protein SAMN04488128_103162 [Chitinophaga eiseniae]|uniref:Uncharacterized protein n=1 Tax=Chitinophaga eiseniae TaxID=634771 RepID=A0A1T4SP95_9BACT|nr:hypothetical protein [Chitinophaga eiseniae]SKA29711.1 hypothetical protein SAMN04488128_103162 [Chitinophaga eiseniae]
MKRKDGILILLALSWPLSCLHQLWRGGQDIVYWFYPTGMWDGKQWYFYHVFGMLSYLLIFIAMWLYVASNGRRDKDVLTLLSALAINQAVDIPHYLICRRQCLWVVAAQGILFLFACFRVLKNNRKR